MATSATYQLWSEPALATSGLQEREAVTRDLAPTLTLDGDSDAAYSEDAFRYFLEIERKRAELSNRPLLLLLVDFPVEAGGSMRADCDSADRVFAALSTCLRDTDFVGWYHESRVVGAVLTQRAEAPAADASRQVTDRVNRRLLTTVSAAVANRLQIRVFQLAPKQNGERSLEGS